jgi:hypothetical protein
MYHHVISLLSLCLSFPLWAQDAKPTGEKPATEAHGHGDADASLAGLKKEMIADIKEDDFLRLSETEKTVDIVIVAVWGAANYGMNFNGHFKGSATYTIPKDWKVNVTFINPSPVPHSLLVIEKADLKKLQVKEPYFKDAAVKDHIKGLAFEKSSFSFTADEAGEYAFACGFPAHATNGHWIALEVSDTAKEPTLKLGTADAKTAAKPKKGAEGEKKAEELKKEETPEKAPEAVKPAEGK